MHSEICAGCGGAVGEHHHDADQATGIKEMLDVTKTEQTHTLGLGRIETTTTTYTFRDPMRHLFTLCEACVRGYLRERLERTLVPPNEASKEPPRQPPKLWVELLVATVVPGIVAAATWNLETSWIRWVAVGALPLWWALILIGNKMPDGPQPEERAAKVAAAQQQQLAAFDAKPWAEIKQRVDAGDLLYMEHAIVRTRGGLDREQRSPIDALERQRIDDASMRVDVIKQGTPHDGKQRLKLFGNLKLELEKRD